ncbi:12996_t:CDS:2, partial [Gigaspora rosea]
EEEIQLELMEIRDKVSQTNQTVHTVEMEPNTKDLAIKDQPDSDRNNVHTSNNSKQPQQEQRVKENMKGVVSLLGKIKHWTSWAMLYTVSGRKNIGWSLAYREHIKSLYDIYKTQQTPPTGSHKNDYKSGT